MTTSVFKVKVKAGREAEFEPVLKALVAATNANETGVIFYQGFRSGTPGEYVMLESFVDAAALESHMATEHFQSLSVKVADFLDGPPEMMRLTDI